VDKGQCSPDTSLVSFGILTDLQYWDAAYPERPKLLPYAFSSFLTPEHEFIAPSPMSAFHHLNPAAHHHALAHANMSFVTKTSSSRLPVGTQCFTSGSLQPLKLAAGFSSS